MGSVFSTCCGRRDKQRKQHDDEREPLLPTHRVEEAIPSQHSLNKFADLLAAINNGKLPSQDQTSAFIRRILNSDVFKDLDRQREGGTLSERGRVVLSDLKEVLMAFLELGLEKNGWSLISALVKN